MRRELQHRIFICVTGMPGAGKSVIARYIAKELGVKLYTMGDAVRRAAKKAGVGSDAKSMMEFAKNLRRKYGTAIVARLILEELKESNDKLLVIDGIRSIDEVAEFKKHGSVVLVAVHASPRERFSRLKSRGRPDDPSSWEEFVERDMRELELGIGNVIALADVMVVNEYHPLNVISQEALKRVREVLSRIVHAESGN
ncbi:MAG: nucleoside monophosphate kinase [Desulfurococcales archaeon]|nr:nucleoside monophosphate kinase [Desulfurococcales archaeon]